MKQKVNLLLMKPKRNPNIEWDHEDKIILKIKRSNKIDKLMNKLFKTPNVLTVELDEIGSFVWSKCDGERNIGDIAEELDFKFGEKINPAIERLIKYISILMNNKFISLE